MKKWSMRVGGWIASGANIATGYIWCAHGVLWALAFLGAFLLCVFALYGMVAYAEREAA